MGKRLIIKGASFSANSIDRVSPSVTYYSVIYNLGNCTASNSATSIAAGSTYRVTITANSGYTISSVTVKHNGVTVNPSSGYTYVINNVSGNITVTATATADVTTYAVTYDLVHATASNNATTVTKGSSYSVTLCPVSGYVISSATVTHNGSELTPTSGYTYNIPSVSGNILVECVAVEASVQDINLSNSILRSDTKRCFLHYPSNNQNYQFMYANAISYKLCVVDVSAYVGYDIELTANFGSKASDAFDGGPAYYHCFASAVKTELPWTGTTNVNNAVTPVEFIPWDGGGYKTKTLTVPQGARYLVCTEGATPIEVVVKNVPKGDFDLTDAILYTDVHRQFIHYPNDNLNNTFQYIGNALNNNRIGVVDISAYVGRTLEFYSYDNTSSASYTGGAYWICFASAISIAAYPWTGTVITKNALTSVEYIPYEGLKDMKTYTLTVPQGARFLVFAAYSNYSSYTLKVKENLDN